MSYRFITGNGLGLIPLLITYYYIAHGSQVKTCDLSGNSIKYFKISVFQFIRKTNLHSKCKFCTGYFELHQFFRETPLFSHVPPPQGFF